MLELLNLPFGVRDLIYHGSVGIFNACIGMAELNYEEVVRVSKKMKM